VEPIRINERQGIIVTTGDFFRRVYNWMAFGLALTALTAVFTISSPTLANLVFGNRIVFWGLIIAEFGLVLILSAAINRLSALAATMMFLVYSALNGMTLSIIFVIYTRSSIASTFFVTAATFGAMSLYGHLTKRDLTSWGSFLTMGLFGVIIASVVNIFLKSEMVTWIVTYIGIFVFIGLTAYDTNKLKIIARQGFQDEETEKKVGILGALTLYLDFINLFLLLLRVLGGRRD
jgi:FtsH-binding integral membrane protein